jgi:putative DNA primase/helicase
VNELSRVLNDSGYKPNGLVLDGKMQRFDREGKKSGWLIGWNNTARSGKPFVVAIFGDWATEERHEYHTHGAYSADDKAFIKKKLKEAHEKMALERERIHEEVSAACTAQWNALDKSPRPNSYLEKKELTEMFGAAVSPDHGFALVIPCQDVDGKIWGLQRIYGEDKPFMPGQRVSGTFFKIGEFGPTIYICEGYATGATIHMATGEGVACAFGATNLLSVAKAIKGKYPESFIIVCGDDDKFKEINAGRARAEEAALAVDGKTIFPLFQSDEFKYTDFDDLRRDSGIEVVQAQLGMVVVPEVIKPYFDIGAIKDTPFPDVNIKMAPRGTMKNIEALLNRLGIIVRYNVISKEEEIIIPGFSSTLDNKANSSLHYIVDWCVRCGIPVENLSGYLTAIADRKQYNPVQTWIESRPWDGQSRLDDFYETVTSTDEPMKKKLMRAWMISAVAAALRPNGTSSAGVLVFQGPQYIGKTKWFKSLVPEHLDVISDGAILRPDDKDSVFQIVSKWIVELGELDATFKKSDMAQLKGFLTKDRDTIRRPYAKKESNYARRTVFFASVNDKEFLNDPTGNRRFWTISCTDIDYNHRVDMQQVWAEFKTFYDQGESFYLSHEDIAALNAHNENFQTVDPIEERIASLFKISDQTKKIDMTASDVCRAIDIFNPTIPECRRAGAALRKMFGDPRNTNKGKLFSVYTPLQYR